MGFLKSEKLRKNQQEQVPNYFFKILLVCLFIFHIFANIVKAERRNKKTCLFFYAKAHPIFYKFSEFQRFSTIFLDFFKLQTYEKKTFINHDSGFGSYMPAMRRPE